MQMEQLYQEIILDHHRSPHHFGLRDPYDAEVHHVNPTCGDEVTLRVKLAGSLVEDISYDGLGCSISVASTSVMTDLVVGQELTAAMALLDEFGVMMGSRGKIAGDEETLGDGVAFAGVSKYPARVKCALLGWMAFKAAVLQAQTMPAGGAPVSFDVDALEKRLQNERTHKLEMTPETPEGQLMSETTEQVQTRDGRDAGALDAEMAQNAANPAPLSDTVLDDLEEALRDVVDPELGVNIVDLGLVYDLQMTNRVLTIDMTLTSAACPLTDMIEDQISAALTGDLVDDYKINWVWLPPWGPEKITDDGREQLRALGFNI